MPIPRDFASTVRRTDQQVQPPGQLPKWLTQGGGTKPPQPSLSTLSGSLSPQQKIASSDDTGGGQVEADVRYDAYLQGGGTLDRLSWFRAGLPEADVGDEGVVSGGGGTTPNIDEIPTSVQDLLGLFDEDLDTPGVQSQIAELAGMSAEELAAHFGLEGYEEYFQPIQQGLLQGTLERIGEQRTFGLGQAQEALDIGATEARRQFGAQAAGIRSGLLGLAQQATQAQAASGFAGGGAIGAAQATGRKQAGRELGFAGEARMGRLEALQEGFESEQARVQYGAEADIEALLARIAEQVGGFGDIAAQLFAGGAEGAGKPYEPEGPEPSGFFAEPDAPTQPGTPGKTITDEEGQEWTWVGGAWRRKG